MSTNFFLASPSGSSHAPSTTPSRSISPMRALSPPTLDPTKTSFSPLSRAQPSYSHPSRSSSSSSLDAYNLPFAAPLPRSDFLQPDFSASAYLSQLFSSTTRHQTLEDLRAELRGRSTQLNQELLDLVNTHYADFLELGERVKGGEEKVEGLAVGALAFQREVQGLLRVVGERSERVRGLLDERRRVLREIEVGRGLLEMDGLVGGLERRLMIGVQGEGGGNVERVEKVEGSEGRVRSREKDDVVRDVQELDTDSGPGTDSESEDGEEDDDFLDDDTLSGSSESEDEGPPDGNRQTGTDAVPTAKLASRVRDYTAAEQLGARAGAEHPFVLELRPRLDRIREVLLLDLGAALREARAAARSERIMRIMRLYSDLDADAEAVVVLRTGR